jgi:hypothetical protein
MRGSRTANQLNVGLMGCALLALGSCGGQIEATSNTSGDPPVDQSSDGGTGFLQDSVEARWVTTFSGVRRVKLDYTQPGVEYRERVGADGQGNFAIETIEVLTPHPDPDVFLAVQDLRQTLSYRYRDFAIKDWALFTQEYAVAIIDENRTIAGFPTVQVRIDRLTHARSYYEVDFDPITSLVLAYKEYDADTGQTLADVAFESLTYQPDLTGMSMVKYLYPTTTHSLSGGNLTSVFEFDPLVPSYIPPGYRLLDEIEKQDAPDGTRAKVYLSDGLDVIILASQKPVLASGSPLPSRMWSTDLGSWTGMSGDVKGYPIMVAGKVDALQQSLMVQSAFE